MVRDGRYESGALAGGGGEGGQRGRGEMRR